MTIWRVDEITYTGKQKLYDKYGNSGKRVILPRHRGYHVEFEFMEDEVEAEPDDEVFVREDCRIDRKYFYTAKEALARVRGRMWWWGFEERRGLFWRVNEDRRSREEVRTVVYRISEAEAEERPENKCFIVPETEWTEEWETDTDYYDTFGEAIGKIEKDCEYCHKYE